MSQKSSNNSSNRASSSVIYCLIRAKSKPDKKIRFLMVLREEGWGFPATKFRRGEDLYQALRRPMEEDLELPENSYFPEMELDPLRFKNDGSRYKYPGLTPQWVMYPVDLSLTKEASVMLPTVVGGKVYVHDGKSVWKTLSKLNKAQGRRKKNNPLQWMTIDEIKSSKMHGQEIGQYIHDIAYKIEHEAVKEEESSTKEESDTKNKYKELLDKVHANPSMDALASYWAAENEGGVRAVRKEDIGNILDAGFRAFNLRVADPYLPYQKQGLGFTWSFFTPKDKQDTHIHGLPVVEIFGVLSGTLNVFYKDMKQRGDNIWNSVTLKEGDWLEIEPLYCHFSYWVTEKGSGTVFKAAATGELGGVGRLGMFGKTMCKDCPVKSQCARLPVMVELEEIYQKDFKKRDFNEISRLSEPYINYP